MSEAKVPANQLLKCILLVSSRLIFHPLRDYPGPLFARLTDAYGGYFALKKRLHLVTYQNFQDYGENIKTVSGTLTNHVALDNRSRC